MNIGGPQHDAALTRINATLGGIAENYGNTVGSLNENIDAEDRRLTRLCDGGRC